MKIAFYLLCMVSFLTGCISERAEADTMQPFITSGDRIVIDYLPKKSYDYGDIVLCQFEDAGKDESFILRIVGLPGDSIAMEDYTCIVNGQKNPRRLTADSVAFVYRRILLYVDEIEEILPNGKKVYLYVERGVRTNKLYEERLGANAYAPAGSLYSELIPSDHYCVLGDARTQAVDSRLYGWVSKKNIKGRIVKVVSD